MPKIDHRPTGARIRFYEQPHEYKLDDGRRLISATTYIKRFFPAFDSQTISARYALKHGLNQQDVLDAWEAKRMHAANFGTDIHAYAEALLTGSALPTFSTARHHDYCRVVDGCVAQLLKSFELVEVEKIVFSHRDMLAGTVDIILRDPQNGAILVLDWKTSSRIDTYCQYRTALPPYDDELTDCNFDHFRCQQNLYRRLLDTQGYFEPGTQYRLAVIHVMEDRFDFHVVDALDI